LACRMQSGPSPALAKVERAAAVALLSFVKSEKASLSSLVSAPLFCKRGRESASHSSARSAHLKGPSEAHPLQSASPKATATLLTALDAVDAPAAATLCFLRKPPSLSHLAGPALQSACCLPDSSGDGT